MAKKVKKQIQIIQIKKGKGKKNKRETEPKVFDEKYKAVEFEKFRLWLALPHIFRKKDARILDALAIQDQEARDLLAISTQKEFASQYRVSEDMLSIWKAEIKAKGHLYEDTKSWVKSVMSNVMGAVYKQVLIDGDSGRAKFLATFVGQYTEKNENSNPAQDVVNQKLAEFLDRYNLKLKK